MPWNNDRAAREHSNATYGTEWRKARDAVLKRDGRRCALCSSTMNVQVDHIVPVSQGGTHHLANLRVLCGSCHRAKTATEGGGYRRGKRKTADPEPTSRIVWEQAPLPHDAT